MSEITSSTSILKPGIPAPNFTLHSDPDQSIALSQFRGHPTILAFYPADFSPVCGDQAYHDASFLPKQCDEIRDAVFKAIEDGLQHSLFYPFCLTENRQLTITPMDDIPYAKLIPESPTGTKIEFDPIQLKTRLSVSLAHKAGRTLFPDSGSTIRNRLKTSKYNSSDYLRKFRAMICKELPHWRELL